MKKLDELKKRLRPGRVYRRQDLAAWSTSVDRHIQQLLETGDLVKLSTGLYSCPKLTAFGKAPADDRSLVTAFLKDGQFLLTSPNSYNVLGVGATQLYNQTVVYNHKRHGRFKLGGREFDFRSKHHFPKKLTSEFLLVDLVNNLTQLAEDQNEVLAKVKAKAVTLNLTALRRAADQYGTIKTKRFFEEVIRNGITKISA